MKTKNAAWLLLLEEVRGRMKSLGQVAEVGLILPGRTGHDAPPRAEQQALQIAQSLILLDWFHQQHGFLSRPEVAHWLESVAQPTCGFLMRSWHAQFACTDASALHLRHEQIDDANNSSSFRLDQRLRRFVRQATKELEDTRCGKNAARDVVELVLELTDSAARRGRGVYFTPPELARFIVKQVNRMLKNRSVIQRSAVGDPFVLDPAVGAGIFLLKVIEDAYELFVATEPADPVLSGCVNVHWSEHAAECILPRLIGCDVMLPSLLATHLNIAVALEETGFDFKRSLRLNLFLANCLADFPYFQPEQPAENSMREMQPERDLAFAMLRQTPVSVIIGNPPFYSRSQNDGRWIQALLRGEYIAPVTEGADDSPQSHPSDQPNYFEIDGQPLNEKKAWLHDDYVKFIRYAQWQIDRAGAGILGFVTNRGFLDNITFRGMRFQLLQSFDHIQIFDLHGDSRNQSARSAIAAASAQRDENIFDIETGVAVTFFGRKTGRPANRPLVSKSLVYESLHGTASSKLQRLHAIDTAGEYPAETRDPSDFPAVRGFEPAAPNYFFVARDLDLQREYERGFRLCDIMPQAWSAPVTARDHFVVAFEPAELEARLTTFRDLSISDDQVRQQFFQRTRSTKYPAGDTRGWKLAEARRQIAADDHWRDCWRTCAYRPWDQRSVFWSSKMIDWPRNQLVQQMQIPGNLALIGRRQSPRQAKYNFFFVADELMLDGILRSDNRGNESIFPLYVELDQSANRSSGMEQTSHIVPNFSAGFIQAVSRHWQFTWTEQPGDLVSTIGPLDLFHYLYALFHSSAYRQRYSELLSVDFPRVFVCGTQLLAKQLIALGARLVAANLLRDVQPRQEFMGVDSDAARTIASGFPKYQDFNIYINKTAHLPGVSHEVWDHCVGSHQVARKWLKDRRGRSLSELELLTFARIIAAIEITVATCQEIDRAIVAAGGWAVF